MYNSEKFKIIIIDNTPFHSINNFVMPDNISLELNPAEQIWQYLKQHFKNQYFQEVEILKQWLEEQVINMTPKTIKSIVSNPLFLKAMRRLKK